jgi:endogenous inhibitor of DNA gyrase (YacG/DUF329 family)
MGKTTKTKNGGRSMKCPTCETEFERNDSKFPPFCSERCKLIDLGHWLNEGFSIPGEPAEPGDLPDPDEEPKH